MPKVIRNTAGEPFSEWKPADKFYYVLCTTGFDSTCEQEHKFDDLRKWAFDYAWPSIKLAVEIDGFGFGHQAQQNIAKQNEKRNAALEQGWRVLVFDSALLGSRAKVDEAVEQVCRVICGAS